MEGFRATLALRAEIENKGGAAPPAASAARAMRRHGKRPSSAASKVSAVSNVFW